MQCHREANLKNCPCTNDQCQIQGYCCDCLSEHLKFKQLPPCLFDEEFSLDMDLSFENFAEKVESGQL